MNLGVINNALVDLLEQMDDVDLNDLDAFGMDAMTRKRLKVQRLQVRPKKQVQRPLKRKMPTSLRNLPALGHGKK